MFQDVRHRNLVDSTLSTVTLVREVMGSTSASVRLKN